MGAGCGALSTGRSGLVGFLVGLGFGQTTGTGVM